MASEATHDDASNGNGTGVGALLKASRQRIGEDLPDVARMLRIRYPYLEAIESGNYQDLPGATYAVGFIRAYADHLGLDSDEVVRRYKAESASGGAKNDLRFPTPVPETGIPTGAVVFLGVLIAAVSYGAWYVGTAKEGFFAELISPIPERLESLLDKNQSAPSNDSEKSASTPAGKTPEATTESSSETAAAPTPSAPVETPPAAETGSGQTTAESSEPAPVPATDTTATGEQPAAAATETAPVETAASTPAASAPSEEPTAPAEPAQPDTSQAVTGAQEAAQSSAPETTVTETVASVAENAPAATTTASTEPATPVEPTAQEPAVSESAASAPAAAEPQTPIVPAQVASAPATEAPEPSTSGPAATETGSVDTAAASGEEPAVETAATTPAAEAEPSAETEQPSEPAPASRILVKAAADSWIQVRDDFENRILVTRLMKAGDSFSVPDQPGLTLLTGNAGALEILVDGEAVPSIGGDGAVRQGVSLDAELLRAGNAVAQ